MRKVFRSVALAIVCVIAAVVLPLMWLAGMLLCEVDRPKRGR
jgi:hypothetical protein